MSEQGITVTPKYVGAVCGACHGSGFCNVITKDGSLLQQMPCPHCLGTGNPNERTLARAVRAGLDKAPKMNNDGTENG